MPGGWEHAADERLDDPHARRRTRDVAKAKALPIFGSRSLYTPLLLGRGRGVVETAYRLLCLGHRH